MRQSLSLVRRGFNKCSFSAKRLDGVDCKFLNLSRSERTSKIVSVLKMLEVVANWGVSETDYNCLCCIRRLLYVLYV